MNMYDLYNAKYFKVFEYQVYFTAKLLREDTSGYVTDHLTDLSGDITNTWMAALLGIYDTAPNITPPEHFNLNSALSNAARHVANIEGPC